jgi:glycosyltransferase involved in cell wall biosynthesis
MSMLQTAPPFAVLVSNTRTPCGVEAFARRLAQEAGTQARAPILSFDIAGMLHTVEGCQAIVVNLPVVAWKRRLLEPLLAIRAARRQGLKIILILHEWDDLDWKRRLAYAPLIALADRILFSCPEVETQFGRSALRKRGFAGGSVPIPPNVTRPGAVTRGEASAKIAAERRKGRLILGHFGSIYPKKQPTVVLEVAAELMARGEEPFLVFIGSFIKGSDRVREDFEERVDRLGLAGRVMVTGYVESEAALFGLFDDVDVFVYAFAEGLTARRGSVYACLASGTPIVVNAPRDAGAFDHHPAYREALAGDKLRLVPFDADIADIADAVVAARSEPHGVPGFDVTSAWRHALAAVEAAALP